MRVQLAKSLQTRSRAIRNAVDKYNKAAQTLGHDTVQWEEISRWSFLEEFGLLRATPEDIASKEWTQASKRLALQQFRRTARAKEEIARCNVETRRLHTSILDEDEDMVRIEANLRAQKSPLYGPLREYCIRRRRVNCDLLARLRMLYALPGFTGNSSPGIRVGRSGSAARTGDMRPAPGMSVTSTA